MFESLLDATDVAIGAFIFDAWANFIAVAGTHIRDRTGQAAGVENPQGVPPRRRRVAAEQVEAITGHYGIGELLNGDLYRAARRYTPTTWRDTLAILDAGGLPGSVADVRAVYSKRSESLAIIGADEYNQLNPDAPNAQAFERRRNTNLAAVAVAETIYDNTQARMVNYETLMGQIEAAENSKTTADLQARIAAENGTSLAELIRLQSVQLQQAGAIEAQQLVDETNMKRQTQYADFPFGELPTE